MGPSNPGRLTLSQAAKAAVSMPKVSVMGRGFLVLSTRHMAGLLLVVGFADMQQGVAISNDQTTRFDANRFFPFHGFEFLVHALA